MENIINCNDLDLYKSIINENKSYSHQINKCNQLIAELCSIILVKNTNKILISDFDPIKRNIKETEQLKEKINKNNEKLVQISSRVFNELNKKFSQESCGEKRQKTC